MLRSPTSFKDESSRTRAPSGACGNPETSVGRSRPAGDAQPEPHSPAHRRQPRALQSGLRRAAAAPSDLGPADQLPDRAAPHRARAPDPVAIAQRCRYRCAARGSKRLVDPADPAPRCLTPQPGRVPMRQRASALMIAGIAAVFGFVGVSHTPSAQTQVNQPRAYNPYPPGILPTDLDEEMARVRREVQFIFNEALNESSSMKRLTNGERCRIRL